MKKFILSAVVAVSLVACNSGSETTETKDTVTTVTTPEPDTTQKIITTEVTTDTTVKHVDGDDHKDTATHK
ncbi:MAG: hypothetical protein EOO16_07070 [Chitinophagaceae bacterium]|nr:MAG: hypothetical protein EOO16_07070 [Chitinophagaceae bacterium]